jgi:hypothetical protein
MPCIAKQPDDIDDDDRLLTEKKSAAWLGMGWSAWTKERDKIEYIRVGKFRRYTKRILRRYQNSCHVRPTQVSERAAAGSAS